jgi:hypothetical protein
LNPVRRQITAAATSSGARQSQSERGVAKLHDREIAAGDD